MTLFRNLTKTPLGKHWITRPYSHGPTVGEVYATYRKLDEVLARVRPDSTTDIATIDAMLSRGDITPTTAEHFKREARMMNEAKSIFLSSRMPSIIFCRRIETAEYWRRILWYVGVPLTLLIAVNTYFLEKEHDQHLEEHPHVPPTYDHLHIRNKVASFWLLDFNHDHVYCRNTFGVTAITRPFTIPKSTAHKAMFS